MSTTVLASACSEPAADSIGEVATDVVADSVTTTVVLSSTTAEASVTTIGQTNPTPTTPLSSSDVASTSLVAPSTTVMPKDDRQTSTTLAPTTSTSVTSTSRAVSGTPRLVLSQSTGLSPSGTRITVRGTGYDVAKGVYVIVCNQAAWTDSRRCVGGINIDGSSPVSEWVSTNPPAYAKGLTVPFASDGSFSITLLVRAIGDNIDCTKESCGVVSFADHTRRDDRSQDVFVPITFVGG